MLFIRRASEKSSSRKPGGYRNAQSSGLLLELDDICPISKKHWTVRKKTKDGTFESREVEGYYAGFVRIPQRYREQDKAPTAENDAPSS